MKLKIKAIGPKVVVKVKEVETVTKGGIHLPGSTLGKEQNACTEGELVSIGSTAFDYLEQGVRPKLGDYVYFTKYAGINKEIDDAEYRIVNDEDIYATEESE